MIRRRADALAVTLLAWLALWPLVVTLWAAVGGEQGELRRLRRVRAPAGRVDGARPQPAGSFASVALAAAIGIPLAFLFDRTEFPGRRTLARLVALPVVLPPLVGVIAFLYLWGESGVGTRLVARALGLASSPWRLDGLGAILLVHAYSMYVYFYLFTRAALARFDSALLEAAASLGAGPFRRFVRVVLPALRPALAGAALLTFLTALGSFSAPYIFGGNYRVMTTQILASKQNGETDLAEVETVVLTMVALAALVVTRRLERGDATNRRRGTAAPRRHLASPLARLASGLLGWALALLLLAPHLTLVVLSLVPRGSWTRELLPPALSLVNYRQLFGSAEALRPVANSLLLATLATAAALALGFAAARAARRGGGLGRTAEFLMGVPWAVPATAFAVALATTHSVLAPWAGRFLLVGTAAILPLAYLARAIPATGRAALSGLGQLDPGLEEAAAALGAGPARRLLRVTLPLLRPALVAGALLAFLGAFGDFVASIVLYTFETRPIAIEILARLRLQETGVAAAYGVLLTIVSAAVYLAASREEDGA